MDFAWFVLTAQEELEALLWICFTPRYIFLIFKKKYFSRFFHRFFFRSIKKSLYKFRTFSTILTWNFTKFREAKIDDCFGSKKSENFFDEKSISKSWLMKSFFEWFYIGESMQPSLDFRLSLAFRPKIPISGIALALLVYHSSKFIFHRRIFF